VADLSFADGKGGLLGDIKLRVLCSVYNCVCRAELHIIIMIINISSHIPFSNFCLTLGSDMYSQKTKSNRCEQFNSCSYCGRNTPVVGPMGPAGHSGMPGHPGIQGIQGVHGVQGFGGTPGAPGFSGAKGDAGN